MKSKVDNRMLWIRNVSGVEASEPAERATSELASEARIFGLLNYSDATILCGLSTHVPDERALYKYELSIGYPPIVDRSHTTTRKGYLIREGLVGEIAAILSFFFECRFYVLSTVSRSLSSNSVPSKTEFPIVHRRIIHEAIDPQVFGSRDRHFSDPLTEFLDCLRSLPEEEHYHVMLAMNHYARALREIGIDEELQYIRLVSAVEAVAQNIKPLQDPLLKRIEESMGDDLDDTELNDLQELFEGRKAFRRFSAFIENYSKGFFKGGRFKAPHTRITRSKLPDALRAIYYARSRYLHHGDPMFLSSKLKNPDPQMHTDPSVAMNWQSRRYTEKDKLPYPYFFHRLVRHCVMRYIAEKAGGSR